jgi:hypothetical protein
MRLGIKKPKEKSFGFCNNLVTLKNYSADGLSVSEVLFVLPVGLPAKN